ncbi:olfactory receptor 4F6 [Ictidomys tridecemlineatus]|uniref:Olfactory receptor n=2 Tax=Marmotini TaxID=337730 RepID=I3MUU5_ICTTR|nr:olfactory receptor 4F6-like [Ictidomys tridecemlineatus]XP_015335622.1 olfactory receptor 4F6-like [Marmota marmota marmota]XP_027781941.1 olfactory receptor 4F6-like [Marmota flaviventris]KAG3261526.1 olfactory receptor 4F6-like [Ictidomys tridecemlineatus]
MDQVNASVITEFVLLGLAQSLGMQFFLLLVFSLFYMGIILGNLFIVFTVIFDPHLHSPMYIFLANLSLIDLGLSSTTVPRMISDLFTDYKVISFQDCMIQMFFIHVTGGVEMVLLIAMAYDRYTAICKPLHYLTIMNSKTCTLLVIAAWVTGVIHAVSQFVFVINLPFCGPNNVGSFYCDLPRVIKLACMDTYRLEFVVTANSGFISMGTFFFLIISYIFILVTVQQHSSNDLSKAFFTLSAHITVVVMFFVPCMFLYVWPFPTRSLDNFFAIVDFVVTPVLNPVIYTLRNKDMKLAMRRLSRRVSSSRERT